MADGGNFLDTIGNAATNLDSGGIFDIFNTGVFANIYFFLKIVFWMGLILGGAVLVWKFWLQYKIRLTIVKEIGSGGLETKTDMAKIVTDEQNKTKLQLMKHRKGKKQACTLPIPEAKYKGKKGKFDHYYLFLDDNMELHPIEPPTTPTDARLTIRPQERAAWGRMEDEMLFKKYMKKDVLMKYAAPAILMTACITAFLIFFFGSKEIGSGMSAIASSMNNIATQCTAAVG